LSGGLPYDEIYWLEDCFYAVSGIFLLNAKLDNFAYFSIPTPDSVCKERG